MAQLNNSGTSAGKEEGRKITIKIPKLTISKINPWIVSTLILLVVAVVLFVKPELFGRTTGGAVTTGGATLLTAEEAGQKAIQYINNNLVEGTDKASLYSAEDFSNDIYKVETEYQGNIIDVYITKDGKWLFVSTPYETTAPITTTTTQQQQQQVVKSDRPQAYAFVMSHCPYGLQFIKAFVPVMELFADNDYIDIDLKFVNYAMHGEKEVYEQLRMYCIKTEQSDKFTDYLRCFVEDGDSESCLDEVGIDKDALQTCMDATDTEYKITETLNDQSSWGSSFPPFPIDDELCNQYGVRGSPTFVLNGQVLSVNRAAESIKDAICAAFNTQPSECSQQLSTTAEQAGLGPIGSGSGASSGGQC